MHFAILTQYYPPEIGAPQARLSNLASHFVARGHHVSVLTAMPNYPTGRIHPGYGGLLRRERRDGVEVTRAAIYPTQHPGFVRRMANYCSFVASSAVVGQWLLPRPDYLMVESPPLFLGAAGVFLSTTKRTRLIFNVSDLWPESAARLGMLSESGIPYRMSARLERFCYQHAWLITGQSKTIVRNIAERFPTTHVLHLSNGVDTRRFRPDQPSEPARAAFEAGDGDCVVVYAGLHGLAQGLDQVIDAADRLRNETSLRFVLIGDGPEKARLACLVRALDLRNTRMLEPRPASDMPGYLAAADIVVISLKTDIPGAVPSKLYEAMAAGRAVVLIASGEAAATVTEHDAGVVVAPGDIEGLVAAVTSLLRNPELRARLGRNGRVAAERHFDRAAIAERFIGYLESHDLRVAAPPVGADTATASVQ